MNKFQDPLHIYSVDKWDKLKAVYQQDWPRGMSVYYALDELSKWVNLGLDYGFKVLVPFGDPKNGLVVIVKDVANPEQSFIEMFIECPQDDTSKLEEALTTTTLIDWNKFIVIFFPPKHVQQCLRRIEGDKFNIEWFHDLDKYVLKKSTPLFDVSLPHEFSLKHLTEDYTEFVDSMYPYRYPGSTKYFSFLIKSGSGYGLFKEEQLVAWGFVKEIGVLGHIYTLEEHRRKGFGELVTKLICNIRLKQGKDVMSFLFADNVQSCKMHKKIGFVKVADEHTIGLRKNQG